ncbi:MAG: glycosyltransferase [Acidobacteria bacterium]|nr:glycosyltransferase [Acidobacteriota bacterium]
MTRRILVFSASAGAGHTRAADALERAFRVVDPEAMVTHHDALESTNAAFRRLYANAYIEMVNRAPDVLGWLYDRLDEPWKNDKLRQAFERLNTRRLVRLMEELEPHAIICTHFLPGSIVSWMKSKDRVCAKHAVVVTDFDVHAMWLASSVDRWYVALDETRAHLAALGIDPQSIRVSGIPVDPKFAVESDVREARLRLGLDPDRTTLLVSAGGFGVGPVEHLVGALAAIEHPAQVVVICGRNEELLERLRGSMAARSARNVRIDLVGFTREMDTFMSAADLLVGKPGGLTTSEALAKGLAIVIVNPIPGQEERNADHLLEAGAAIRANNLPAIGWKVDQLLADRSRLAAMRACSKALGRPDAARAVAEDVLSLIE